MLLALRFFFTAVPLVLFLKPPKLNLTLFIYAIGTFVMQYAFVFTAMHLGSSGADGTIATNSDFYHGIASVLYIGRIG